MPESSEAQTENTKCPTRIDGEFVCDKVEGEEEEEDEAEDDEELEVAVCRAFLAFLCSADLPLLYIE